MSAVDTGTAQPPQCQRGRFIEDLGAAMKNSPDADSELVQFWSDVRLTWGIVAYAPHSEGVAALFRIDEDSDVEYAVYTWADLEAEWAAWNSMAEVSA
ncbi:hypothetical protein [Rothia halotolerans]|uniref:hypothetical protein n=1 Tax=Rothia halotolerans TaxID=405770 RepID=UPI0013E9D392|nr:hypothetical protein [Rothia halotolerans]